MGRSLQVGKGASSSPVAQAPPPGWLPAAWMPLTCRRSVAGCHIFQAAGFGRGDAGETQWMRLGARGCGPALHLGSVSPGCASGSQSPPRGGRRELLRAEGGSAALSRRQLVGTAARGCPGAAARRLRSSARARERTAAAAATAPSSSSPAAASGPARSEHARGRRPATASTPRPRGPRIPASGAWGGQSWRP